MQTIIIFTALLAFGLATAPARVVAQAVYKTIGVDGKVVYSDHPPIDSKAQSTLLSAPKAAPEIKNGGGGDAATKESVSKNKPAKLATQKANAADSSKTVAAQLANDDVLEGAVIGVMGMESLVLQTEEACVNILPTSMRRYTGAASAWRERNAPLIAQQRRLLATAFDADKRRLIVMGIKNRNDGAFMPFKAANAISKIKWCDQSMKEIENGAMDVFNNPKLAPPIMNYKAK